MSIRIDNTNEFLTGAYAPSWGSFSASGYIYISTDRNALGIGFILVDTLATSIYGAVLGSDGTTLNSYFNNAGSVNLSPGTDLTPATWYNVGVTYDGAVFRTYLGAPGSPMVQDSSISVVSSKTSLIYSFNNDTNWINGRYSSWKMWSGRVLTAAEFERERVLFNFYSATSGFALYRFLPGAHTTDSSGNSRTLVETGTISDEADPPYFTFDGLKFSENISTRWIVDSGPDGMKVGDTPAATIGRYVQNDGLKFSEFSSSTFPGESRSASDGMKIGDSPTAVITLQAARDRSIFSDSPFGVLLEPGGGDSITGMTDVTDITSI